MNKIIAYSIAKEKDSETLAAVVSNMIGQGWQPFGNVYLEDPTKPNVIGPVKKYCQPLVKYADDQIK